MRPAEYFAPKSLEEAFSLLSRFGERGKIVSGGTDLLMDLKHREDTPAALISLVNLGGLDYIRTDRSEGLRIGSLTKLGTIAGSAVLRRHFGVLAEAANLIGSPAVRNQATIGGNLCNAAPSADLAPALLVLAAKVKIAGPEGEKVLGIDQFFTGPGSTVLRGNQILTEIIIPSVEPHAGAAYLKHTRRQGFDLAVVGVAGLVVRDGKTAKEVRIGLGAVAPTPIRAKGAEASLRGREMTEQLLEKAGLAASEESLPISDIRGSADYRRRLVAVLTKRVLSEAVRNQMEVL